MLTLLIFLFILSTLILVHELGHFFAAKKLGVAVEEFGLGLPPRAKKLFTWKGTKFTLGWLIPGRGFASAEIKGVDRPVNQTATEFTLNWLPFGGFVRMRGEDADPESPSSFGLQPSSLEANGFFYAQKPWKRAVILLAGVTMNLIFGIAAFTIVYSFLGIPTETDKVIVQGIAPNSPAAAAGFKENDVIVGFSTAKEFIELVNQNRGQEIYFSLTRSGSELEVSVVPRPADQTPEGEGALGVAISNLEFIHYPWWKMPFLAAVTGIKEALGWSVNIVAGLGSMLSQLALHGRLPKDVAGPVGIAYIAGNVARQGWLALVQFAGILSVNLAVVNILPIPALDGGRLLFLGIEKLRGRPVEAKKERWAHLIGYAVLISLILLATIQDILRILSS